MIKYKASDSNHYPVTSSQSLLTSPLDIFLFLHCNGRKLSDTNVLLKQPHKSKNQKISVYILPITQPQWSGV